jgi:DNA polymerase-3 subunit delta
MSNIKQYSTLLREVQSKQFKPIYLLNGEEPYYIDRLSKAIIANGLEEHERDFNLTIMYGKDANPDLLLETLRRFPMMAERQVVVLREAQSMDIRYWPLLESYFNSPTTTSVFVIDYKEKKANGNNRWVKMIGKVGVNAYFKKHYDNEIPEIVTNMVRQMKYRINPTASHMLAEYLGSDLEKIEMELDKLTISVPLSKQIEVSDVQEHIGFSKEFNVFEYIGAVAAKDVFKSYQIAQFLGKNDKNNPVVLTLTFLFGHFSKLMMYHGVKGKNGNISAIPGMANPYASRPVIESAKHYNPRKTAEVLTLLREYDAMSKGVGGITQSADELMKELTFRILN